MMALTASQTERLANKTNLALTLAIILGAIEILRRTPRLFLLSLGMLVCTVLLFAIVHVWWIVAVLAILVGWKLARVAIRGWREYDVKAR